MCRHSANLGDLQGRAARSLLDITEECFYPFLNRFYQFLTTPQMHLVNIQCDNAPERALHLTGEEEESLCSPVPQFKILIFCVPFLSDHQILNIFQVVLLNKLNFLFVYSK